MSNDSGRVSPRSVLGTADLHDDWLLAEGCSEIIHEQHVKECVSNEFPRIDLSTLTCFLRASTRGDERVYDAVRRWATEKCFRNGIKACEITATDRRDRAKSITHLIKFHEYKPYSLASGPASQGLLSKEECYDAFMSLKDKMNK